MMHWIFLAAAGSGIGYPSAEAALEALRARGNVEISVQDGWTIADDKPNHALWSFTPPSHPAHPAVVRRTLVRDGEHASIQMDSLCVAGAEACEGLVGEFRRINQALQDALAPRLPGNGGPAWQPTASQKVRVEEMSKAYFAARDAQRYREAYELLGSAARQQAPFEQWRQGLASAAERAGAVQQRELKRVTIYLSSQGGTPATYAAVDFSGRFANADTYCAYLIWSEQSDGSFRLVREEENFIYKETGLRLTQEQRSKMRGVYRCVD